MEEVRYTFGSEVLSKLVGVEEILERKLFAVTKPLSNCPGVLPDVTLDSGGETTRMQRLKVKENVRSSITVFAVPRQNVFCHSFFFAEHTVTGVLYLHMLEEFLMPIRISKKKLVSSYCSK